MLSLISPTKSVAFRDKPFMSLPLTFLSGSRTYIATASLGEWRFLRCRSCDDPLSLHLSVGALFRKEIRTPCGDAVPVFLLDPLLVRSRTFYTANLFALLTFCCSGKSIHRICPPYGIYGRSVFQYQRHPRRQRPSVISVPRTSTYVLHSLLAESASRK